MGFKTKGTKKITIYKNPLNSDMEWKGEKDLQVYEEQFEKFLMQETKKFYS